MIDGLSVVASRFSEWLNKTQMPSFAAFNSQIVWLIGSIGLTYADIVMLTSGRSATEQAGIVVTGILVGGWTGKSYQNRKANEVQRTTSREYLKAQADLQVATSTAMTAEHPDAVVAVPVPAPVAAPIGPADDHEWASGDPRAGVL
jgi:hypothetical protein